MTSYIDHFEGFFKFYGNFDYSQVMSTYSGKAFDPDNYTSLHRNFELSDLNIADPFTKGNFCGDFEYYTKGKFINLCKASTEYLEA